VSVQLRELAESDLKAVAALVAEVFDRPVPEDGDARLRWLLFDNPDRTPGVPCGWVLWDGDRPVGFIANVARRMAVGGRDALAACTAKFVVRPSHRFHGLMLAKKFFDQTNVDILLCSTANQTSAPILERFGGRFVAGGDDAVVFVIRAGGVVSEVLRRRGYGETLRKAAAFSAGGVMTLVETARRRWPEGSGDIRVDEIATFDEGLDDLWARAADDYHVHSRRDALRMNWLFRAGPKSRWPTTILGAFRGDRLDGYLVCQDRGRVEGVRRREVMDVFTRRDDVDVFDALVGEAGRMTAQQKRDTLEFRNLPADRLDRLVAWGARRRKLDVNPFLVRVVNSALDVDPVDASQWYLVPADGDGAGW